MHTKLSPCNQLSRNQQPTTNSSLQPRFQPPPPAKSASFQVAAQPSLQSWEYLSPPADGKTPEV